MSNTFPVIPDLCLLRALSLRLSERAAEIDRIVLEDWRRDLLLAAQCADKLMSLRNRLAEIAQAVLDRPERDSGAFHRDLIELLNDREAC